MKMRDERRDNSEGSTTIQSPLPVLLRSLYLHGVEYCALAGADRCDVYTKDQIVSLLERGDTDRTVCEAIAQLEPGAFACGRHEGALDSATRVLLVTSTGSEVVAASSIPETKRPKSRKTLAKKAVPASPPWWDAPIPLAMCAEKGILLNSAGRRLLAGLSLPPVQGGEAWSDEFILEAAGHGGTGASSDRQFLFERLEGTVYLVQDVTEDLRSAGEMAWLASVGQAFISHFKCRGRPVRQVRSAERPADCDPEDCVACIWEGELLGYVCLGGMSLEE